MHFNTLRCTIINMHAYIVAFGVGLLKNIQSRSKWAAVPESRDPVSHVLHVNILPVIVCLIDLWSSVINIHSYSTWGIVSVCFGAKVQLKTVPAVKVNWWYLWRCTMILCSQYHGKQCCSGLLTFMSVGIEGLAAALKGQWQEMRSHSHRCIL